MFPSKVKNEERQGLLFQRAEPDYGSVLVNNPLTRWRSTCIEPVMFLILMARTLSDTVITNLLENRTCRVLLELPEVNCTDPISPALEDLIQPTTAQTIMVRSLIEAFIPACMSVLIGPWSDANGRKPFMLIAFAGISITYIFWGCLALLPNLHPYMFLVASLPLSLTGGWCAVYLLCFCYLGDITNEESDRSGQSIRMALLSTVIHCSYIFGTALAPALISAQRSLNPYPLIFFLSACLMLLSTLYTHWFIKESVELQQVDEARFFTCSHIKSLFFTCFQRRSGYARSMIFLIITSFSLNIFIVEGEQAVFYLAAREKFSWQLSDYSEFNCFSNLTLGVGALVGVWLFSTWLDLPNMFVTALLYTTRSIRSVMMAVARSTLDLYFATAVSSFVIAYNALCRTELSKMVPKQDLGKIFASIAFLEAVTPLAATPLYTFIYQLTFIDHPGAIFMFSAVVSAITVLMILIVFVIQTCVRGECYNTDRLIEETHVQTDYLTICDN